MPEKRAPWVVLLLALLAFWQAPRLIPLADGEEATAETAQGTTAGDRPAWKEPLRLYQEFFGLATPVAAPKPSVNPELEFWRLLLGRSTEATADPQPDLLAQLQERFRTTCDLSSQFTIVLVPDPLDSHLAYEFDQALEAIQMAYANAGYLLDRQTMPWFGEGAAARSYRSAPGLMLFRKEVDPLAAGTPVLRLASVFVVGESPKQGIQKEAFGAALQLIRRLQDAWPAATYDFRIVGPSLSGSVFSLRQALLEWQARGCTDSALCPGSFQFITGTATAPGLEERFKKLGRRWPGAAVTLDRTVARDDELWANARPRLQSLGWDLDRLALLSEADTAYGQQEANQQSRPIEVRFPSGLEAIRKAWETDEEKRPATSALPIPLPRTALALVLTGSSQPVDVVKQASDLNLSSSDLTLSNLLAALRRDGVRYIGLRASDTRDRIFLAKHIRRTAPGTVLFTYGNSLLYSHPTSGGYLQGTLVLTSFPLALEDESWGSVYEPPRNAISYRRQFGSAFQQGVYLAAHKTLESQSPQERPARSSSSRTAAGKASTGPATLPAASESKISSWIAVVGGDSLWPLMRLDVDAPGIDFSPQDQRNDLTLLALMMGLFACAAGLGRLRRPPHGSGDAWPDVPLAHRLVVLAAVLVVVLSAALVLVATLPFWNLAPSRWRHALGTHEVASLFFLAAIGAVFGLTLWRACAATLPNAERPSRRRDRGWRPQAAAGRDQRRASVSVALGGGAAAGPRQRSVSGRAPGGFHALVYSSALVFAVLTAGRGRTPAEPDPTSGSDRSGGGRPPGSAGAVEKRVGRVRSRPAWLVFGCALGLLALVVLAPILRYLWMPGGPELFDLRARRFSSGLSPLPPFLLSGLGLLIWLMLELSRGRLLELHGVCWPLSRKIRTVALTGAGHLATELSQVMRQSLLAVPWDREVGLRPLQPIRSRRFWLLLLLLLLPPGVRLVNVIQPICEPKPSGWLFLAVLGACVVAGASSFRQFFASWRILERLLRRIELTWLRAAFERIAPAVSWSPMRSFGWRVPALQIPVLSRDKLKDVPELRREPIAALEQEIDRQLEELFSTETGGAIAAEHRARRSLDRLLRRVSRQLSEQQITPAVQDFLAVRVVAYLRPVFVHMRHCLLQAMACFLLALAATSFYAFQPQWFVQMALWAGIVAGVVLTFWAFVQMDRHAVLSAVGGTQAGEVTFDRHFFGNLFTYAVVPVVGALVVYFPPFGRVLLGLFGSLTRVTGGG